MFRRLPTVFRLLCLLLFAASVVLWIRSYQSGDGIATDREALIGTTFTYRQAYLDSSAGGVMFNYGKYEGTLSPEAAANRALRPRTWGLWHTDSPTYLRPNGDIPLKPLNWLGFYFGTNFGRDPSNGATSFSSGVSIPWWSITLALALPNAIWLWRRLKRLRARRRRLCLACGYDLRSTSDRCPECGAPVHEPTIR